MRTTISPGGAGGGWRRRRSRRGCRCPSPILLLWGGSRGSSAGTSRCWTVEISDRHDHPHLGLGRKDARPAELSLQYVPVVRWLKDRLVRAVSGDSPGGSSLPSLWRGVGALLFGFWLYDTLANGRPNPVGTPLIVVVVAGVIWLERTRS